MMPLVEGEMVWRVADTWTCSLRGCATFFRSPEVVPVPSSCSPGPSGDQQLPRGSWPRSLARDQRLAHGSPRQDHCLISTVL